MAAAEDHLFVIGDVGGHGAERNRQLVEIAGVAGMHQQAFEQQCEVLTLDHAQWQAEAAVVAKAELLLDEKVAVVLLAPVGNVLARRVVGQHLLPVEGERQSLQLGHAIARRVEPADHCAHAGAGDGVDAHTLFLQGFQHPDMGQPARGTAGQHQAGPGLGRFGKGSWQADNEQQESEQAKHGRTRGMHGRGGYYRRHSTSRRRRA